MPSPPKRTRSYTNRGWNLGRGCATQGDQNLVEMPDGLFEDSVYLKYRAAVDHTLCAGGLLHAIRGMSTGYCNFWGWASIRVLPSIWEPAGLEGTEEPRERPLAWKGLFYFI
ncbi:hypothetical protein CH63R_02808 [Colletotrichum higginsianum IMI 349063]|uniref:Uncharacterized protein n=1 Tax=Colletotrichum higginsianum (strain IMI 349063) TaxID=759273 RepID=A0A1B7YQ51_COLHI|nr:hypothetical protein CH63R_02808 [Colletotrichum higginsianum IMI 349063]OBR14082.1 hypothetical protein CH63R_02808 [Colletotrichum higginsianum IMI 349063]